MKIEERKSVTENMKIFDPLAKEHSYIEVIEWSNGEGWDINIDDKHISLHFSELDAINFLIKALNYGIEKED